MRRGGIGKTSLVRAFVEQVAAHARVLMGACDDLVTPRALGPLRDAAAGTGGRFEAALTRGGPDVVFDAVVELLTGPVPTVLLIEDLHWVDEATLDVLVYLVRRLPELPGVLVVTCRDDALAASHPAQRLLGALSGCPVHRPVLAPLSTSAVDVLAAGAGRPAAVLHELTGGNPFYVTEALRAPADEVPVSVADAVLARVRRLPEPCRQVVEQLAVVPTFVEIGLAEALLGDRFDELAGAEAAGIIEMRTLQEAEDRGSTPSRCV